MLEKFGDVKFVTELNTTLHTQLCTMQCNALHVIPLYKCITLFVLRTCTILDRILSKFSFWHLNNLSTQFLFTLCRIWNY